MIFDWNFEICCCWHLQAGLPTNFSLNCLNILYLKGYLIFNKNNSRVEIHQHSFLSSWVFHLNDRRVLTDTRSEGAWWKALPLVNRRPTSTVDVDQQKSTAWTFELVDITVNVDVTVDFNHWCFLMNAKLSVDACYGWNLNGGW